MVKTWMEKEGGKFLPYLVQTEVYTEVYTKNEIFDN